MITIYAKRLTLWCFCTLLFYSSISFCLAQTYTSDASGNWEDESTWDSQGIPPIPLTHDDTIVVLSSHVVTRTGDVLSPGVNNVEFDIAGTLTITGNLQANNDMTITIQDGGTLNVGNLTSGSKNNTEVVINGNANFTNVSLGNEAAMLVNGSMVITGSITVGDDSNLSGTGTMSVGSCTDPPESSFCESGPLPVELLRFSAKQIGNGVSLDWSTASEQNNDYFTLARSGDGIRFDIISTIQGNGTVNSINQYQYIDTNPLLGLSYYRLSQTDYDGTTEQFPLVSVLFAPGSHQLSVYPNPLQDGVLQVRSSGRLENETLTIRITDIQGRMVKQVSVLADAFGNIDQEIAVNNLVSKNTYIVELISKSDKETVRILSN